MASEMDEMDGAVDAHISNGTCWSGNNVKAAEYFISCGNAAVPDLNFACCYTGDTCLSSNSCYNAIYGITYIAGCTDRNYSAPVCGDKGNYSHQEWVGLVRCYVSDDLTAKDEEWAGCQEDQVAFPITPRACDCEGKKYLFRDKKVLTGSAKVPLSSGGSISFLSDYEPTVTQVVTVSATSWATEEGPAVITAAPTQVSASDSSVPAATSTAQNSQPLSTDAEVGMLVMAGVFCLLVTGLLLVYVILRKRRKKPEERAVQPATEDHGERAELEAGANSRRIEGGPVINAGNSDDDEPHISQHARASRQYFYGPYAGRNRYHSGYFHHRLSTISEHSTIPDPQSPGSPPVLPPAPQATGNNSENPSGDSGSGQGHAVEHQTRVSHG